MMKKVFDSYDQKEKDKLLLQKFTNFSAKVLLIGKLDQQEKGCNDLVAKLLDFLPIHVII